MKRYLIYSIALGLIWCFVHGTITPTNFLVGLVLGPFVIYPFRELYDFTRKKTYINTVRKIPHQLKFLSVLLIEIIKANIMVAKIVLSPKMDIKPGIVAVPIRTVTDTGITAIANTITLTPGTLTLDVSDDRKVLYVHAIDASDPQGVRDSIRDDLEKYVLEAFE
ncbi:multisubunit sodium/proton antiporter, MrpE subunit [Methanococcoides vulcani]|uniref:Multisubunit sodium/proton antiporter, MrpE subunit n=1 Tax=Methanococcoides vulcani TaxID=1353158 RepID=A0A1I0BIF5_9EURY|nr:Na+/H+ antiporter subunit E [Methanococcoides vulcani]SET06763.1 multisubunit sodium/proton antiporter, MrpE subunit [Methanococcoides vulcani]